MTSNCVYLILSLPDGSGYDLCEFVKKRSDKPVIFLTAFDDEVNVVMGLDMGADYYITKPFRIRELLSRIKSVWRRKINASHNPLTSLRLKIFASTRLEGKVYKKGEEVLLTALEYRLFLIFADHIEEVRTRSQLLERIWDVGVYCERQYLNSLHQTSTRKARGSGAKPEN